jgi:hypothetical protein
VKRKYTRDEIRDIYAKHARISKRDAEEAVDSLVNALDDGGSSLEKWAEILSSWGWGDWMETKAYLRDTARMMRKFGVKSRLVYTCECCGTKVEVKV